MPCPVKIQPKTLSSQYQKCSGKFLRTAFITAAGNFRPVDALPVSIGVLHHVAKLAHTKSAVQKMFERMENQVQHMLGMGQRIHRYSRALQWNGPVGRPFKKAFQSPVANVLLCGAIRMQFQIKARFAVQKGCIPLRRFSAGNQLHSPLFQQLHTAAKAFRVQQQILIARDSLLRSGYNSRQTSPLTTTGRIPWMSNS